MCKFGANEPYIGSTITAQKNCVYKMSRMWSTSCGSKRNRRRMPSSSSLVKYGIEATSTTTTITNIVGKLNPGANQSESITSPNENTTTSPTATTTFTSSLSHQPHRHHQNLHQTQTHKQKAQSYHNQSLKSHQFLFTISTVLLMLLHNVSGMNYGMTLESITL